MIIKLVYLFDINLGFLKKSLTYQNFNEKIQLALINISKNFVLKHRNIYNEVKSITNDQQFQKIITAQGQNQNIIRMSIEQNQSPRKKQAYLQQKSTFSNSQIAFQFQLESVHNVISESLADNKNIVPFSLQKDKAKQSKMNYQNNTIHEDKYSFVQPKSEQNSFDSQRPYLISQYYIQKPNRKVNISKNYIPSSHRSQRYKQQKIANVVTSKVEQDFQQELFKSKVFFPTKQKNILTKTYQRAQTIKGYINYDPRDQQYQERGKKYCQQKLNSQKYARRDNLNTKISQVAYEKQLVSKYIKQTKLIEDKLQNTAQAQNLKSIDGQKTFQKNKQANNNQQNKNFTQLLPTIIQKISTYVEQIIKNLNKNPHSQNQNTNNSQQNIQFATELSICYLISKQECLQIINKNPQLPHDQIKLTLQQKKKLELQVLDLTKQLLNFFGQELAKKLSK